MSKLGNRIGWDPRNFEHVFRAGQFWALKCLMFSNLQGGPRERVPCGDDAVLAAQQDDRISPEK